MTSFRFIFILLFSISSNLHAGDRIPVSDRLKNYLSPIASFPRASVYNPAAMAYTDCAGLTDLLVGYEKQTGNAGLLQTGTAHANYAFRAKSFLQPGKHRIWGKASYLNGNRDNIKWNESSDYHIVYPYVMADSVGGNNLSYEQYDFEGGYALKTGKIAWGVELAYRALMEYRVKDPRPDNISSDLSFKGGLNYRISKKYALGTGFLLRKYKQKNTLEFYNALGNPKVYHMTGLGTDAHLFAGKNTSVLFDGGSYGWNVQLLPVAGQGLSATVAYELFSFEKQLPGFQYLPISRIDEDSYKAEISYLKRQNGRTLGIKVNGDYTDRTGTEDKFILNTYGNYVKIASAAMYANKTVNAILAALYGHDRNRPFSWYISPYGGIFKTEESHQSPLRKMNIIQTTGGIHFHSSVSFRRSILHTIADASYTGTIEKKLLLTGLPEALSVSRTLHADYDYLSADRTGVNLTIRWDYILPKETTLYLKADWKYKRYNTGELYSQNLEISAGVAF